MQPLLVLLPLKITPSYHDEATELEDLGELAAHGILEVLSLHLSHLATREVKYFLAIGV